MDRGNMTAMMISKATKERRQSNEKIATRVGRSREKVPAVAKVVHDRRNATGPIVEVLHVIATTSRHVPEEVGHENVTTDVMTAIDAVVSENEADHEIANVGADRVTESEEADREIGNIEAGVASVLEDENLMNEDCPFPFQQALLPLI